MRQKKLVRVLKEQAFDMALRATTPREILMVETLEEIATRLEETGRSGQPQQKSRFGEVYG